ncbi:MAG: hypothetical protein HYV90_05445 [Candidatus Woesebacteria bacterium]|nr:MAG: hypothetical protein HYV90_05445 [Candidatus Woesebacteria bacterium]
MKELERPAVTGRGLPIVTSETFNKILDADRKGSEPWGEMLNRVKDRLVKEQPVLARFLESQGSKFEPEEMLHIIEVAIGVYALLEQQANINKMSDTFSVTPESK